MGASAPIVSAPPAQERRFNISDDVVMLYEHEDQVKFIKEHNNKKKRICELALNYIAARKILNKNDT